MADILFALLAEPSHHVASFKLARALRGRGHRVSYLGIPDSEPLVRAQGFEMITFAGDLLPPGYLAGFDPTPPRGLCARWRKRRAEEPRFVAWLRRIEGGELDDRLRSCAPDVVICDPFLWYVALRALRLGIPTIQLSGHLALSANSQVPPMIYGLGREPAWLVWSAWRWMRIGFFFSKRVASVVQGAYRSPTRMHHLLDVFLAQARRSGYPCVEEQSWRFTEFGPRLALPEITLCPAAFQLPGAPEVDRRYAGDFIDVERREESADELTAAIDPAKPLVYCSLGTNPRLYPHAGRFFRAVVQASASRGDWQVVLHVGGWQGELGALPPKLLVRRWVPQLELLRRAAVMVTHGGASSIAECVHFGVPMVVVPGLRDQPGNAVRVAHHGLGLTERMAAITGDRLAALVARAITDERLRAGVARMRRAVAEEHGLERAIDFIESTAGGAG